VAEVAEEIAAALAFAATRNSDRLSLVIASDRVERVVPAGSGRRQAVKLLSEFLSYRPEGRGTDLVPALDLIARRRGGRALVFLIGDFLLPDPLDSFESALGRACRLHDIVAVRIFSPEGEELPSVGWVEWTDPESGKRSLVNTARRSVRRRYQEKVAVRREAVGEALARAGAEIVDIRAGSDPLEVLAGFLTRRRGSPR
jgi:uncharacterized protein (DUF58 family)